MGKAAYWTVTALRNKKAWGRQTGLDTWCTAVNDEY